MCLRNNHLGNKLTAYLRFMVCTLRLGKHGVTKTIAAFSAQYIPGDQYCCTEKYGVPFVSKLKMMLVFTIRWYLRFMLVFTIHAGIYDPCWYLHFMLVS